MYNFKSIIAKINSQTNDGIPIENEVGKASVEHKQYRGISVCFCYKIWLEPKRKEPGLESLFIKLSICVWCNTLTQYNFDYFHELGNLVIAKHVSYYNSLIFIS